MRNPLFGKFDVYSWHVETTTKLIFLFDDMGWMTRRKKSTVDF